MRRSHTGRCITSANEQFPEHIAKARNRTNRQAIALSRQWWQSMIGTENITRTINKEKLITLLHELQNTSEKLKGTGFSHPVLFSLQKINTFAFEMPRSIYYLLLVSVSVKAGSEPEIVVLDPLSSLLGTGAVI